MAKAGDAYRELVGTVVAMLDPQSTVKTEQWIVGPDGERDMDVEVRGKLDGIPHFVLVERKDHARPIGIGYIDAFESKLRDLKPDSAIMSSNSGFTRDALKKASRVGIQMMSAMKAGDTTVKIQVQREVVARRLTLRFGSAFLYPFDGRPQEIEENWKVEDLLFDGLPVIHWISEKMKLVAMEHDTADKIWFICTFRHEPRWSYRGRSLMVGGLKFSFAVKKDWVWYALGLIDNAAWEKTESVRDQSELEVNSFRLDITIMQSNLPRSAGDPRGVDGLVVETRVDVEYQQS